MAAAGDPQALNRFAYVRNNPLKYVDSTGLCFTFFGQTYDCSAKAVTEWVRCAFGGCGKALGGRLASLALWGLQQTEFWTNVLRLGTRGGRDGEIVAASVLDGMLGSKSTASLSQIDALPRFAFEVLGALVHSGGRPDQTWLFTKASLIDLRFRTNRLRGLFPLFIPSYLGARPWWGDTKWYRFYGVWDTAKVGKAFDDILWRASIFLDRLGGDVDALPWSREQRLAIINCAVCPEIDFPPVGLDKVFLDKSLEWALQILQSGRQP